ncbi:hypothetical protein TNCV_2207041 [Trichonephila clavipes]|uniref:Uncharacterized protein n=1 Tax=Trichonephila clavipes TaxID=2585209 RepID=A0A8X6VES8_TRICX|nr:hypothetical protein TNCV_2207041 [Trichonephila clavipes]
MSFQRIAKKGISKMDSSSLSVLQEVEFPLPVVHQLNYQDSRQLRYIRSVLAASTARFLQFQRYATTLCQFLMFRVFKSFSTSFIHLVGGLLLVRDLIGFLNVLWRWFHLSFSDEEIILNRLDVEITQLLLRTSPGSSSRGSFPSSVNYSCRSISAPPPPPYAPRESLLNLRYSPMKLHEELPDSYLRPQRSLKTGYLLDEQYFIVGYPEFHGIISPLLVQCFVQLNSFLMENAPLWKEHLE